MDNQIRFMEKDRNMNVAEIYLEKFYEFSLKSYRVDSTTAIAYRKRMAANISQYIADLRVGTSRG